MGRRGRGGRGGKGGEKGIKAGGRGGEGEGNKTGRERVILTLGTDSSPDWPTCLVGMCPKNYFLFLAICTFSHLFSLLLKVTN